MGKNHQVNVDFKNSEANVKANIVLISFKEDDNYIIYSPHLDVPKTKPLSQVEYCLTYMYSCFKQE